MHQTYNFDIDIDRRGTGALKVDALAERFGRADLEALWVADMDFPIAEPIMEALRKRLEHPMLGYTVTPDSYKEAVCRWLTRYGISTDWSRVSFIPGVVKGIAMAINHFTTKGDSIVVQPPVYHPFRIVAEGNGRRVVDNPLIEQPDGSYAMDLDGLEHIAATERPKMLVISNPHNPGGVVWSAGTLRSVADIAARHGIIVISDEIHGDLIMGNKPHTSFTTVSADAAKVGITFGAPSKTFNLAGVVSSWCYIASDELREGFFNWLSANEFNEPTLFATIATEVAYTQCADWLEQLKEYLRGNIALATDFIGTQIPGIRTTAPDATYLMWLDCRELGLSHERLVALFTDDARLALNDGSMFGRGGEGFMRLNVALPRHRLAKALNRLSEAVSKL